MVRQLQEKFLNKPELNVVAGTIMLIRFAQAVVLGSLSKTLPSPCACLVLLSIRFLVALPKERAGDRH